MNQANEYPFEKSGMTAEEQEQYRSFAKGMPGDVHMIVWKNTEGIWVDPYTGEKASKRIPIIGIADCTW